MGGICGKDKLARVFSTLLLAFNLGIAVIAAVYCAAPPAYADGGSSQLVADDVEHYSVDEVERMILGLSADPLAFKADDLERVTAIQDAFESLSAADQAVLDSKTSHEETGQPLGRVLEAALWAVWSYDEIDDSTTLDDGVYNASTTPKLFSEYSKGKSTSGRQKPWGVKEVTVKNGKAVATLTVESDTYSGVWMGGVTYPKTNEKGNCEFAGIPIDLNSTFYFAGISTSMPVPIAFSLTTEITERSKTPLEIAKDLIAALPADPDTITENDRSAIEKAAAAYDALTDEERAFLDEEILNKDQSYGRWLESAQWGLMALQPLSNATSLVDGDYSDVVSSSSSMGKSNSERNKSWSIVKLTVSDGKALATLSCGKSLFRNVRIGGVDYPAVVDSAGIPYFTVPIAPNETVAFTADFNAIADSIAYQLQSYIPSIPASTTRLQEAMDFALKTLDQGVAQYTKETGAAVKHAAENLKAAASKKGVTYAELSAASKLLGDALTNAKAAPESDPSDSSAQSPDPKPSDSSPSKPSPGKPDSPSDEPSGGSSDTDSSDPGSDQSGDDSSSSSSGSADPDSSVAQDDGDGSQSSSPGQTGSQGGSSQQGATGSTTAQPTSQGGKTTTIPTAAAAASTGGRSVTIPKTSNTQASKTSSAQSAKKSADAQAKKSGESASKTAASKTAGAGAKKNAGNEAATTRGSAATSASAFNLEVLEDVAKANRLTEIMVLAAIGALLLVGMCVRVFQFVRNRD